MTLSSEQLLDLVLEALDDLKARDVVSLDVRGQSDVTDAIVVASGTSNRQVKALADHVVEQAKAHGVRPLGSEGEQAAEWILVDLGDVVVHIMQPAVRQFYQLERLWGGETPGLGQAGH